MANIIDANIIIYSAHHRYIHLRKLFEESNNYYSSITLVEVLGYHKLSPEDRSYFSSVFELLGELPIDKQIISRCVDLRQSHNLSLGDALVAATALHYKLTLVTHNVNDFKSIADLIVTDPLQTLQ